MKPFDFQYVFDNYRGSSHGLDYVYYPARTPKRLLVTFASLNEGGHFQRIRQFWSPEETWDDTAFLFFRDQSNQWYANLGPYQEIISAIAVDTHTSDSIFVSGSCMGSYGALLCGLTMQVAGVLLTATRFPDDVIPSRLEVAAKQYPSLPHCYIEARGSWADQETLKYVADLYRNRGGLCLVRSMPESKEHWAVELWNPTFTINLIRTLETWSQ